VEESGRVVGSTSGRGGTENVSQLVQSRLDCFDSLVA